MYIYIYIIKHKYLRSRAYICLSLSSPSSHLLKIYTFSVKSRTISIEIFTRAYILDPCIQEFLHTIIFRNISLPFAAKRLFMSNQENCSPPVLAFRY